MAGFFVVFFSQRQEIIITYSRAPNEVPHVETKIAWDFGIQSRDFCVKMRGWTVIVYWIVMKNKSSELTRLY